MKRGVLSFALVLSLLGTGPFPIQAQDKPGQSVTVTSVEVPVRVLHKGELVKGLTKEDFEVYENGVRQDITGFEVISRRISPETALSPEELKIPSKPRMFILIFQIFDYNRTVEEGIDYFFQTIFRPGDRLVILAEDRALNAPQSDNVEKVSKGLKETLKTYKSYSTFSVIRAYSDLSIEGDKLLQYLRGQGWASWHPVVTRFYDSYQRTWNDYKRQFFTLDIDLYRSMIQRLKSLPGDKWAFCFEQRQMFPKLRKQGPLEIELRTLLDNQTQPQDQVLAQQIRTMQLALQTSMDIVRQFPGERLRELFMQAGITFHHIMMKSPRVLESQDFELTDVGQDYEDCFRRISVATGGAAVFSNKVAEAIQEASVKEDYRYLVAYSPADPSGLKERKIDVKVKRQGVDVVSLKQYVAPGSTLISIADFKAGQKAIKFGLKNYARITKGGKTSGSAAVRIVIFDDKSKQVFADGKTLELVKDETNISLNFPQLASGSYFIIIDVLDRTTGGKDVYSSAIRL
jgi:VWFA-related protein